MPISVFRPACVDSGCKLLMLLLFSDSADLVFREEARVSFAFSDQLLGIKSIYIAAVALRVVAVFSDVAVLGNALIKLDAEKSER